MLTVFSYDISQSKRRRKALPRRPAALLEEDDSLRVYSIGHHGEQRSRVFGDGTPFESDEGYWLF